jgi:ribosome biogenesis GTPase / thiamine phosphate phosphatase
MADPGRGHSGLVVALQANYCWVTLDRPGPAGVDRLLCTRRTRLGKSGQRICVGDRVALDGLDWPAGRAAVARLEPRRNLLERPGVANVDRMVVVVALAQPTPDPLQLTRFLLSAEAIGQPLQLVLSKADLVDVAQRASWCERLGRWGYDPIPVSLVGPAAGCDDCSLGLEQLRQRLREPGIAVVCGPSGVGKSSLLNALLPHLDLRVGEVSGRLRRGRHTTRHVELFTLPGSEAGAAPALVADTPGFNRPELPGRLEALACLFPEIRSRLAKGRCRYSNCRHLEDPGCAVGSDWERHPLYRQCLQEVLSQAALAAVPETGGLRRRGDRIEPRLQARWRQTSRRRARQGQGIDVAEDEGLPQAPGS